MEEKSISEIQEEILRKLEELNVILERVLTKNEKKCSTSSIN
jgi:hypothetical protein